MAEKRIESLQFLEAYDKYIKSDWEAAVGCVTDFQVLQVNRFPIRSTIEQQVTDFRVSYSRNNRFCFS